ncbi:uncharacterized protein BDV17DRAFT_5499 [Aspergillus undulatus]|uniref:uncharacterized protein n=1 Tax=Aspergillus undulatus TaxID=1810928 RepID=UPI003CCD1B81
MDAYAYLIRHGWSGPGNPLNPDRVGTRGGLGLTKPLLVARRSGNSGIGKTTTKDPTNQWWLRGFEDALKGIGEEKKDMGVVGKGNALTSELYRFFVRGETVPGTLGNKDKDMDKKGKEVLGKRKRGGDYGKESKEEKRVKREEKKKRKEEKVKRRAEKEGRRRVRAEKKEAKIKKAEEKAERKKRKAEEKEKKRERKPENDYPTPVSMDLDSTDVQNSGSSLDTEKTEKIKKKEKMDEKAKENKKDKASEGSKMNKKQDSSSDEGSKRKSKKMKST